MMKSSFYPGLLIILIGMLILVMQDRFKKPCSIIAAASGILGLFTLNSSSNLVYQITPGIKLEYDCVLGGCCIQCSISNICKAYEAFIKVGA